jgi:hypothetical protein
MKIISKYKDYYDYLQGVYGVDEKLILDRTKFTSIMYIPSNNAISTIHIGEWKIQGYWFNNKIHFGKEVEQFSNQNRKILYISEKNYDKNKYYIIANGKFSNLYCLKEPEFLNDKSPTWIENCSILEGNRTDYYNKFPILREYNIQKVFSAEKVWQILSEWLGKQITRNEKQVPIGDDKTRILSHGFDLKTSFRKM